MALAGRAKAAEGIRLIALNHSGMRGFSLILDSLLVRTSSRWRRGAQLLALSLVPAALLGARVLMLRGAPERLCQPPQWSDARYLGGRLYWIRSDGLEARLYT